MDEKPTTDEKPTVRWIIDLQRRLMASKNPFKRRIGTLLAVGVLDRQMSELTDKQVGQLVVDEVEGDLSMYSPESTICRQATERLFRSESGSLEEEALLRLPCPKCGNEMLLRYGIDEPDFFQCVYLGCEYKQYFDCDEPRR